MASWKKAGQKRRRLRSQLCLMQLAYPFAQPPFPLEKKSHSFPTTSSSASPINAGVLVSLRILNYILLFSLLTFLMDDLLTSYNYFYMLETLKSESPAKIIFHPTTQWISHMQFNTAKAEPITSLLSQTCFSYYP